MGSFVYIPISALLCYLFMGLPLLASKRNRLINAYLWMLLLLILWSGASFCMRMQLWPSVKLWYDLSLLGLIMFPAGMLNFLCEFTHQKASIFRMISIFLLLAANLFNMLTGYLLAAPEVVITANGEATFVYHPTWAVSILFFLCGVVTLQAVFVLFKRTDGNKVTRQQFLPVVIGIIIIFLGNSLIMLPPFRTIPLDIASGVLYAMCLFYALYQKRLFRLTLLISRSNCYALAAVISLFMFLNLIKPLEQFLQVNMPHLIKYQVFIGALFFTFATQIIYHIMKSFIDRVFVKDEIMQAEQLKQFSMSVSKSLKVDEILEELIGVIQNGISVNRIYICIADMEGQVFNIAKSTSSLDENVFTIQHDNPVIQWLKTNDECLIMKDFRRTPMFKSMWENEKQQLSNLGIECFMPLRDEAGLTGIVMLSGKSKNQAFSLDDINFLSSVEVVASIAVKNSRLYEKAYNEARIDELTGLLNRKCFYEVLNEEYEKNKNSSLALVILNLDDFKLYNQLYGNREGDLALQNVARIIKTNVGNRGHVARYSGKEFAVILPMYDPLGAKTIAENISQQISNMNKRAADYALKALTVSVGICCIPYGSTTLKQLLDNVDMAIYQVKRNGKNAIMIYSAGPQTEDQKYQSNTVRKEEIYSEYAPTIFALTAAIDTKDHYTFSHSKNVAYYSTELARAFSLNEDTVEIIREAALLHDVGKIGISEQILNKPGRLTQEQYEVMKGHVENSIGIIRHLPSLNYVIPAVIGHHERYDGKGYPRRIAGEDIPLSARILCIADSFDAIISKRSYKEAYSIEYALEILDQEAGKQFDPQLTYLFINLVRTGVIKPQLVPQISVAPAPLCANDI